MDEAELVAKGYVVLTRAGDAGVDIFAKDDDHLTLFFQGHPEYDGDTLAREYRRDVGRALSGATAPEPPANYYAPETELPLACACGGHDGRDRGAASAAICDERPAAAAGASVARKVVGNWLAADRGAQERRERTELVACAGWRVSMAFSECCVDRGVSKSRAAVVEARGFS